MDNDNEWKISRHIPCTKAKIGEAEMHKMKRRVGIKTGSIL
jgi:hypothetical protein